VPENLIAERILEQNCQSPPRVKFNRKPAEKHRSPTANHFATEIWGRLADKGHLQSAARGPEKSDEYQGYHRSGSGYGGYSLSEKFVAARKNHTG
jgi:hypothetical protein